MRIAFRFKTVPFIATLLLVVLGIALGRWQDRRADEKLAVAAELAGGSAGAPLVLGTVPLAPEQAQFRRVSATGSFVAGWPVYLDNRPHEGRAGFYVLMPFRIQGTAMHVLVARGWLPRDAAERQRIAPYPTPSGPITIEGVAKPNTGHVMELGDAPPLAPGAIVQNAGVAQVAAASGLQLQPFVLEQTSADGSEGVLLRDWPRPDLGVDKHRGYAFQWYALALTAFLFFIISGLKNGKSSGTKTNQ
ncbi:SURF1 family protein [Pseudoduganella umbonata]|uniref:SURF1-like protein n=1 Tax=Pseudoduganella umbonata TaxID=864828 RepID=A0A4P8HTV2_9BURK|nr:SURF1 family protein [Pseudoduganella umbonata]MBB3224633.1 cytochrome oxidase assembly protein ShyY1 [Pseudoduganella umbonata]QCP13389.1 SURF1 family protein [Pseudoduganella umbonata]